MLNDPFKDFDRSFDRMERKISRGATVAFTLGVLWLVFVMGAIGTALWLAGRYLGAW